MPRQHVDQIIVDEESDSKIGSHQLPYPVGWKVLVQPNQVKTKTKGGILLPSQAMDNEEYLTAHGTLLRLGELAYRDRQTGESWKGKWPCAGDRITYGKYAGQKIIIDGVKLLILNDDEITSVLPDSANVTAYLE
jgi:chaperonin GroES